MFDVSVLENKFNALFAFASEVELLWRRKIASLTWLHNSLKKLLAAEGHSQRDRWLLEELIRLFKSNIDNFTGLFDVGYINFVKQIDQLVVQRKNLLNLVNHSDFISNDVLRKIQTIENEASVLLADFKKAVAKFLLSPMISFREIIKKDVFASSELNAIWNDYCVRLNNELYELIVFDLFIRDESLFDPVEWKEFRNQATKFENFNKYEYDSNQPLILQNSFASSTNDELVFESFINCEKPKGLDEFNQNLNDEKMKQTNTQINNWVNSFANRSVGPNVPSSSDFWNIANKLKAENEFINTEYSRQTQVIKKMREDFENQLNLIVNSEKQLMAENKQKDEHINQLFNELTQENKTLKTKFNELKIQLDEFADSANARQDFVDVITNEIGAVKVMNNKLYALFQEELKSKDNEIAQLSVKVERLTHSNFQLQKQLTEETAAVRTRIVELLAKFKLANKRIREAFQILKVQGNQRLLNHKKLEEYIISAYSEPVIAIKNSLEALKSMYLKNQVKWLDNSQQDYASY